MAEYIETAQDYRIKFGQCYVRLLAPSDGEAPIALTTEDVETDPNDRPKKMQCVTYKKNEKNQTVAQHRSIPLAEIELKKLTVGVINTSKSIVIINQHKPEGNARYRALQHKTSMFLTDPLITVRRKMKLRSPKSIQDWFILNAWADSTYSTPNEALDLVSSGVCMARAFSNKFYFTISSKTDKVVLMYLDLVVGRVIDNIIHLRPSAVRFKELLEGYGFTCTKEEIAL